VFDGDERDMFGDFTIVRVRVNTDDKTPPFTQLYDINPKTEGLERTSVASTAYTEQNRQLTPMFIGEGSNSNRTKGGLWNAGAKPTDIVKPGHIEPRRTTSLTSAQMGGAASAASATLTKPYLAENEKNAKLFAADTVSGKVVLRGYAEDDQRVWQVDLVIGSQTVTILQYRNHSSTPNTEGYGNPADNAAYTPPRTGLLAANLVQKDNVFFTDSIDLYRHRVEWAYIWDTETIPADTVVGDVAVRVIAYNRDKLGSSRKNANPAVPYPGQAHTNASPNNPGFPVGLNKYNQITMNLRPYITGFLKVPSQGRVIRSRQGRYVFALNDAGAVRGFNLGGGTGNQTQINFGRGVMENPMIWTTAGAGTPADYGLPTDANAANHIRRFDFYNNSATNSGYAFGLRIVRSGVNYYAVNNGPERPQSGSPAKPAAILAWNTEYSPGIDGSELWDDFTMTHVWSEISGSSAFASTAGAGIYSPSMSIDPATGDLWESHAEGAIVRASRPGESVNDNQIVVRNVATSIYDYAFNLGSVDSYRSPGATGLTAATWVVVNSDVSGVGRGGLFINGPGGVVWPSTPNSLYYGEGNYFNQNDDSIVYSGGRYASFSEDGTDQDVIKTGVDRYDPNSPAIQFTNPHIVTSYYTSGSSRYEIIRVSYYDAKDGSIKYRHNVRGNPGEVPAINEGDFLSQAYAGAPTNQNFHKYYPKFWTNLDGGLDLEDSDGTEGLAVIVNPGSSRGIQFEAGTRVVGYVKTESGWDDWNGRIASVTATKTARNNIKAGKHNSIAVTAEGYPVIAYYDETNSRLKLAVSRYSFPVSAEYWVIRDYVIPRTQKASFGTGEYVSMKIDTKDGANRNRVHIAAMNADKRLVYITGILNPAAGTVGTYGGKQDDTTASANNVLRDVVVNVLDKTGIVGKLSALSLDADGNPWITYMDEIYDGMKGGNKVAYRDTNTFNKGSAGYFPDSDADVFGNSLAGWETMHVPTAYTVNNPVREGSEHGRLAIECYPTRNTAATSSKTWKAAVGYLSQEGGDKYRVMYYLK